MNNRRRLPDIVTADGNPFGVIIKKGTAGLRPETRLMRAFARMTTDDGTAEGSQTLLRNGINWYDLVSTAYEHRVMPLVYRSVRATSTAAVPAEILQKLHIFCNAVAKYNLYRTGELVNLIDWLGAHQIRAIPYKGPTLALAAYGDISLRQFGDLDILVDHRDYSKTRELFVRSGFALAGELNWECSLLNETGNVCVDLHRAIVPADFSLRLDFDYLFERLEPFSTHAGKVATLSAEDLLIVLCVQLAKDGSVQHPLKMSKISDLAELVRMRGDIDWGYVRAQSRKLGCTRILSLGLTVVQELMDAPSPGFLAESRADPSLGILAAQIYHRSFHEARFPDPGRISESLFRFKARERLRDKIYPNTTARRPAWFQVTRTGHCWRCRSA
jgi:Uncharacterised nucleotidyltransferase